MFGGIDGHGAAGGEAQRQYAVPPHSVVQFVQVQNDGEYSQTKPVVVHVGEFCG